MGPNCWSASQCHVGDSAGNGRGCGSISRQHTHHQVSQTEYIGARRTKINLHLTEDHLGVFFSDYGSVEGVSFIKSKADIATSDYTIMVTLTRPKFNGVPNSIICGDRNIFVIVEGHRPNCWACGAVCPLAKLCPDRSLAPHPQPTIE